MVCLVALILTDAALLSYRTGGWAAAPTGRDASDPAAVSLSRSGFLGWLCRSCAYSAPVEWSVLVLLAPWAAVAARVALALPLLLRLALCAAAWLIAQSGLASGSIQAVAATGAAGATVLQVVCELGEVDCSGAAVAAAAAAAAVPWWARLGAFVLALAGVVCTPRRPGPALAALVGFLLRRLLLVPALALSLYTALLLDTPPPPAAAAAAGRGRSGGPPPAGGGAKSTLVWARLCWRFRRVSSVLCLDQLPPLSLVRWWGWLRGGSARDVLLEAMSRRTGRPRPRFRVDAVRLSRSPAAGVAVYLAFYLALAWGAVALWGWIRSR